MSSHAGMQDTIYRFSFTLGTILLCFGFAYYSTHSPSWVLREEDQHKAYWAAHANLEDAQKKLSTNLKRKPEYADSHFLDGSGTVTREVFGAPYGGANIFL